MAENKSSTGHLFKPGQSGNPGGRPKASNRVRELARALTEDAIKALHEGLSATRTVNVGGDAIETADHPTRIFAAQVLLDRGWGKPTIAVEESEEDLSKYSLKELMTMFEEQAKAAELDV
jgi:hypothetical protein